MTIYLAEKTLAAIDEALEKDGGAKYRQFLGQVIPHMGDAFRAEEDSHRSHLGASLIGRECARELWYSFHWVTKNKHPGRIIRLFNRGHLEEARFIALLLTIGCSVYQQDAQGRQFRISHARGHFGGSGDGIAVGLPDLPPGSPALCEFKTHNDKSFAKLKTEGVRSAKFEHFVQMNCYMYKMQIPVSLYMAVNKNTDELHAELIMLDSELAQQYMDRATQIIEAEKPPQKLPNASAGFFKCKFCDHRALCHLNAQPQQNCRTCQHSRPIENGEWACAELGTILTKDDQTWKTDPCSWYSKHKDL